VSLTISQTLEQIGSLPGCRVRPPSHTAPALPDHLALPADLAEFYGLCDGVDLFMGGDYATRVPSPSEFRPTNLAVTGETGFGDRSDEWFTVGLTADSECVSIDLAPARLGLCYDSFHENHGIIGESKVVAESFTEFLESLVRAGGQHWYWLQPDFPDLGDAYDERC
jgi:hypothetical protein